MIEIISKYGKNEVAMYVATKLIQKDIEFSYTNNENIVDNPKILINGKLSSTRELYDFIISINLKTSIDLFGLV